MSIAVLTSTAQFEEQEIDVPTFLTLTEPDLSELGVSTFGARRKMGMGMTFASPLHSRS